MEEWKSLLKEVTTTDQPEINSACSKIVSSIGPEVCSDVVLLFSTLGLNEDDAALKAAADAAVKAVGQELPKALKSRWDRPLASVRDIAEEEQFGSDAPVVESPTTKTQGQQLATLKSITRSLLVELSLAAIDPSLWQRGLAQLDQNRARVEQQAAYRDLLRLVYMLNISRVSPVAAQEVKARNLQRLGDRLIMRFGRKGEAAPKEDDKTYDGARQKVLMMLKGKYKDALGKGMLTDEMLASAANGGVNMEFARFYQEAVLGHYRHTKDPWAFLLVCARNAASEELLKQTCTNKERVNKQRDLSDRLNKLQEAVNASPINPDELEALYEEIVEIKKKLAKLRRQFVDLDELIDANDEMQLGHPPRRRFSDNLPPEDQEALEIVRGCLSKLSQQHRALIWFKYLCEDEIKNPDIAAVLGINPKYFRQHLHQAMNALRKCVRARM